MGSTTAADPTLRSSPGSPDDLAWERKFQENAAALRRLCRKRLGGGADVDDACQETLLRAWRGRDRFDDDRPFWPWLATIAGHVCIDIQRRRTTSERHVEQPCVVAGPEERALSLDDSSVVRHAFAALGVRNRTILFLRDVMDWPYDLIGEHQSRSPQAVRTAVARARHQLRLLVDEAVSTTGGGSRLGVLAALIGALGRRGRRIKASSAQLWPRMSGLASGSSVATGALTKGAEVVVATLLVLTSASGSFSPDPSGTKAPDSVIVDGQVSRSTIGQSAARNGGFSGDQVNLGTLRDLSKSALGEANLPDAALMIPLNPPAVPELPADAPVALDGSVGHVVEPAAPAPDPIDGTNDPVALASEPVYELLSWPG